ncbi:hypothetical protein [Tahibacter harae]|uniref:Ferritin-like domain-containing protein n=1 Tax=Tahibacter harae TaxID=2963937 RepID=A0ABT1QTF8_9GAMM|nr:hypothetical protein [Tahibacter harae]MCQ4165571.1 hypothetical protein [Tahibacter harae]
MSEREADIQRTAARLLRRRAAAGTPQTDAPLWPAEHFGLHRLRVYSDARTEQQRGILNHCAQGLLRESWFVERGGMEFCARMVLAADSAGERQLYSLIGADEAAHYAWLQPWLPAGSGAMDTFNRFLADCVAQSTPQPLAYLMQVVLEGFGIVHYDGLAANCNDPALADTLRRMAEDEALHHAAGLAAFRAERLGRAEREFLLDASYAFLQMMRSGPQAVVAALDQGLEGLDITAAQALFAMLDDGATTAAKLQRLRRLMDQPGMGWLLENLEARGAFNPCDADEMAAVYRASR